VPGPLIVDGEPVAPQRLRRIVDDATRALEGLGVHAGTAVSTPSRTGIGVVVAALAAARLGALPVLGEELLAKAGPELGGAVTARVCDDPAGRGVRVAPFRPAAGGPDREVRALPEHGGAVFWTSGSTGTPKAVLLPRSALDYQASAGGERFEVSAADHWVVPIPLSHAYGFSILQMWLAHGCTLHVLSTMHPGRVVAALGDPRSTMLDGVPALYRVLCRLAERDPDLRGRLAALRLRGCGGDVLPESMRRGFARVVGRPIHDGYGLTEAGPNVAVSAPSAYRDGTVGRALRGTALRLEPDTGELLVRGPGLMSRYLDAPNATADVLTPDGWLRSGDRAELTGDGFVRIVGRLKEVIIVQGETFAPSVIEQVLLEHPQVADAAVVGLALGDLRGDHVAAYVVPRTPQAPGDGSLARELSSACRAALPPVMRPRSIETLDALPLLPNGKLDRAGLRRRGGC
jgi:acyl-CoA synthetase (AMP-forming)/AMP-acid ligase II